MIPAPGSHRTITTARCSVVTLRHTARKNGVDDGVRTRDHWSHSPVLYQLSYIHHHLADRVALSGVDWRAWRESNPRPTD